MKRYALLPLFCALLVGCGQQKQKYLGWARSADSSTLDPAAIEWGEDAKVTENLFETLVTFAPDSTALVPGLAESWEFSPDGRTLTFQLRTGVKFHDGTPLTPDDVVFTFQRILDPDHPQRPAAVPYRENFANIASVEGIDPQQVALHLKEPSPILLYQLSLFTAGIVPRKAVTAAGDQWPRNPVGTGPYRLARWQRDVKIVLEAFPGYWGPAPAISRVIVTPVQSAQTAIQKLKIGEVHVVDHPTLEDIEQLRTDPDVAVNSAPSLNTCYLGFNVRRHPYSDLNFRRAVSLALDRSTLNELVYSGLAEPAANIVPPAIWRDTGPTPPYELDLEKAKALLAQVDLEGNQVELIHMTFPRPYAPEPARVAEWVKDQLRRIGLDVKLTGYDKVAYTEKTRREDHPMYLLGWNADYPDPDNFFYPLLHGRNAGDLNGSFFDDPEFNAAVLEAQSRLEPEVRAELYRTAFARYRDQLPTLPLVHVRQLIVLSPRVSYHLHPLEYRFFTASFKE